MTTLHALRRSHALTFSELAVLTAVPARTLANFEYEGHPLSLDERQSLAMLFGVADHLLEGGFVASPHGQTPLAHVHVQALVALAAGVTLAWSLRSSNPQSTSANLPSLGAALVAPAAAAGLPDLLADAIGTATSEAIAEEDIDEQQASFSAYDTFTASTNEAPTSAAVVEQSRLTQPFPALPSINQPFGPQPRRPSLPTAQPTSVAPTAPAAPEAEGILVPNDPPLATPTPLPPTPTPEPTSATAHLGYPHRCPIVPQRGQIVVTQGWGIGTHAPAAQWGALDLAIMGGPTAGVTVVATHAGYVQVLLDTWPGGNYVSISGDAGWRTAYAHLETVLVNSGDYVEAGTPIGTVGSTGYSTGPHLHYETWENGVNVDPSPVLYCP